jgi:hypothetical protein
MIAQPFNGDSDISGRAAGSFLEAGGVTDADAASQRDKINQ